MKPLRISILRGHPNGNYRVRCHLPLSWLQGQGAVEVVPPRKAWEADVVVLQGLGPSTALPVATSLRRNGIRVVADVDQNIFAAPADHPSAEVYSDSSFQAQFSRLLAEVDAVFVPTDRLAASLARFSSKILVVPNGIDLVGWRKVVKARPRDRVRVVGFAGTLSHKSNLEMLRPALARLSNVFWKKRFGSSASVLSRPGWVTWCRVLTWWMRVVQKNIRCGLTAWDSTSRWRPSGITSSTRAGPRSAFGSIPQRGR